MAKTELQALQEEYDQLLSEIRYDAQERAQHRRLIAAFEQELRRQLCRACLPAVDEVLATLVW